MKKRFIEFFVEKYVLGLEEDITLEDLGTVRAKLDTGNGAYNVLHGENLKFDDNVVRFTTVNNFVLEKPFKEMITIKLGAGNEEERPVCLFNCKIGGREFPNIPFSIGNRSDNIHKVLIGKNFIQKQLDALIDVAVTDLADKNLEVSV
jgi:hypothetical protein